MNRSLFTLFSILISLATMNAQNDDTKKGDKHFNRLEYVKAIEDYEKLVEKDKADTYVYRRLAQSYYNLYKTKQAERFYERVLDDSENANPKDYLQYAKTLQANGKYDAYKKAMKEFATMKPNDSRAQLFSQNPNYVDDLKDKDPKFDISKLSLNSSYSDFGAYENGGQLYFVSARNESRRTYGWNDQPTLDIYVAQNIAGTFKKPELMEGDVNTKFNEGTVAISQDGKTLFFTRNAYEDGDYQKNEEGVSQLKIYEAKLVNDEWQDIQPLPFTSKDYATANPSLSPDGEHLYFSSNMPGGYGNSDIYRVKINDDGTYGEPENLGENINTEGRENFPYIDDEERLFFSSEGHLGLGGLDVFYIKLKNKDDDYPKNAGQPVNSSADDFAFTYIPNKKMGYVSSNRGNDPVNDNIYKLDLIEPLDETMLNILVTDRETNKPIEQAEVAIYDEQENMIKKANTKKDGYMKHKLISEMDYDIQVNASDYESNSKNIMAKGESMNVTIPLQPVVEVIDTITIDNSIFFAFDKAKIKEEAAFELDKIVNILKENPELKIKITSHTDRRGPESYNKRLSEKRAENTLNYIVEAGIDKDRLKSEGKGESELKIECGNQCTEEDHRKNRRSEFTVMR